MFIWMFVPFSIWRHYISAVPLDLMLSYAMIQYSPPIFAQYKMNEQLCLKSGKLQQVTRIFLP